ncbi:putative cation exchanger [Smittium mucronatum]|uniref:Putative cation exchanger n=1 Tax=Smittium mucronatum TaxID=133383 RepID=A0A1R0H987_9FUNG|nr:putative cation exchanger [Smittium mucronatum]
MCLSVLILLTLFLWIGITASDYFSPNLQTVAQLFKIPDSIAGVTLLALGNGAPDIFTNFNAIKSGSASLAIGELIGAAMFVICVVSGLMIIITNGFSVPKAIVYRELFFLFLASLSIFFICFFSFIDYPIAISMLTLYLIYVSVIAFIFVLDKRRSLKRNALQNTFSRTNVSPENFNPRDTPLEPLRSASSDPENYDQTKMSLVSNYLKTYPRSLLGAVEFQEFFDQFPENPQFRSKSLSQIPNKTSLSLEIPHHSSIQAQEDSHSNHSVISATKSTHLEVPIVNPDFLDHLPQNRSNSRKKSLPIFDSDNHFSPNRPSNITDFNLKHMDLHKSEIINPKGNSNMIVPTIHISPPSIISTSELRNANDSISGSEISLNLSNSTSNTPEQHHPINRYWHILITFIPTLKKWNKKGNIFKKILLLYSSIPVLLLNISIPVVVHLPYFHNSNLGLDEIWDVLSVVSQSIAQQSPVSSSPQSETSEQSQNEIEMSSRKSVSSYYSSSTSSSSDDSIDSVNAVSTSLIKSKNKPPRHLSSAPAHLSSHEMGKRPSANSTSRSYSKSNNLTVDINVMPPSLSDQTRHRSLRSATSMSDRSSVSFAPSYSSRFFKSHKLNYFFNLSKCIFCPLFISFAFMHIADTSSKSIFVGIALGALAAVLYDMKSRFAENNPTSYLETHNFGLFAKFLAKSLPVLDISPTFFGIVAGLFWIYLLSNEIVAIMQSLGAAFGISDGLLGLTVLALGNSVGDLATNLAVARLGYPIMGISACFGGPLLNILIGIGLSSVITLPTILDGGVIQLTHSRPVFISSVVFMATILFIMAITIAQNFRLTKITGYCLIFIYVSLAATNFALEYS